MTCIGISYIFSGVIISTILSVLFSIGVYFGILYLLKNEMIREIINALKSKNAKKNMIS